MHKALTYLNLPPANRKAPGESISPEEWAATDPLQTEEDIQALIEGGSISEDMDAELHPDHRPVPIGTPNIAQMIEGAKAIVAQQGDNAPKEIQRLARMEHTHVGAGDGGGGSDGNA